MMMFCITFFSILSLAEPIARHNMDYKEFAAKIAAYEKRVEVLVKQKQDAQEGPDLENILDEISELQKELVGVKKKRRQLRDHVTKNHSREELLEDLSILKDTERKKGQKADPGVDLRLDEMLKKLRTQYARSDRSLEVDYSEEQKSVEDALNKKRKNVEKEMKDDYIKENIKNKLKVD